MVVLKRIIDLHRLGVPAPYSYMRFARGFMLLVVVALLVAPSVRALETQARLVLAAEAAAPGETIMAGVHLHMNKKWHTYWRNPGAAGEATKIDWVLPPGIAAGPIMWPTPEKYNFEGIITYVYHDDVVLLVPLTFGQGLPEGPLQIKAKLSWMECEEL